MKNKQHHKYLKVIGVKILYLGISLFMSSCFNHTKDFKELKLSYKKLNNETHLSLDVIKY